MPIATLQYNLSDEDDRIEYEQSRQASGMSSALWDFDQLLRRFHKYGAQELKVDWPEDSEGMSREELLEAIKEDIAWEIRELFHGILTENDVDLDP